MKTRGILSIDGITWVRVVVMTGDYEGHSGHVAFSYLSLYNKDETMRLYSEVGWTAYT